MSLLERVFGRVAGPLAAVQCAADRVTALRLERHGTRLRVAASASVPLPPGSLAPDLHAANVRDTAAVRAALTGALTRVGQPARVLLLLPDASARVAVVHLATIPARADELREVLRWQVKKSLPFPVEESRIAWSQPIARDGGWDVVVTAARASVVGEYEAAVAAAGSEPGIVDVPGLGVVNAARTVAPTAADWMVLHGTAAWVTAAVFRGTTLLYLRGREADGGLPALTDMAHQTAMYHEDRLQGAPVSHVVTCGSLTWTPDVHEALRQRLGCVVETLSLDAVVDDPGRLVHDADAVLPMAGAVSTYEEGEA